MGMEIGFKTRHVQGQCFRFFSPKGKGLSDLKKGFMKKENSNNADSNSSVWSDDSNIT